MRTRVRWGSTKTNIQWAESLCLRLVTSVIEYILPRSAIYMSHDESIVSDLNLNRHVLIAFQRRLSDPSANINNFTRSGWRTKDNRDKSRSENEGLDSMVSGVAEVEAGDLRDGTCRPPPSRRLLVLGSVCSGARVPLLALFVIP